LLIDRDPLKMIDISRLITETDPRLGPYDYKYPRVVITGGFPLDYAPPKINTLNDLKYSFYYGGGRPRVSSTPLSVFSAYNRFPYVDQGSLQTSRI
jgi:hypothetical protein